MRRAILATALALALPATADASHEAGATYEGAVTTGQGGEVTLEVSDDGTQVNAIYSGLGNLAGTCTGIGFETGPVPITDHSFSFTSPNGLNTADGAFGRSIISGGAQVLGTTPCSTGSQAWRVVGPDSTFDLGGPVFGSEVFHPKAKGQTLKTKAKRGETVSVLLGFYNAGVNPAVLNIGGCDKGKVLKPRYLREDGADMTALVIDNDHSSPELDPGSTERYVLELRLKVLRKAKVGKVAECRVTADDGLLIDTVAAEITVKKG